MKIILKINLFLFASSSKKLIFLFILLLLLPFAGCKSVVKETVVEEPVRIFYPNGYGVLTYPLGEKIVVGEWKDGKRNGQGSYYYPSGEKYAGEWKNGNPWNITGYDKNGNIIGKIVNGEQQ